MSLKRERFNLAKCWKDRKYLKSAMFREQKLAMLRKIKEAALKPRKPDPSGMSLLERITCLFYTEVAP